MSRHRFYAADVRAYLTEQFSRLPFLLAVKLAECTLCNDFSKEFYFSQL